MKQKTIEKLLVLSNAVLCVQKVANKYVCKAEQKLYHLAVLGHNSDRADPTAVLIETNILNLNLEDGQDERR